MSLDTSNNNSNPLDTLIDPSHYKKINWTPQLEDILIEWADKAMCFRWLHAKSNARYHLLNTRFTIPVIVISTLTGTANFAQERFGESVRPYVALIIGFFNILAGIIQTVQQFLKITELNEAHRVSSVAWDKFYRNIKTELAQEPDSRTPVGQMLKACKEEFDRLSETSPRIPDSIIVKFNEEFSGEEYKDISKPEICGSIKTTGKARFVEKLRVNFDNTLEAQQKKILHAQQHKLDIISQFCDKYKQEKYRDPYVDEIYHNIKDEIEITKEEIEQLVKLKLSGKPLPKMDIDIKSTKQEVQSKSEASDVILDLDKQNIEAETLFVDEDDRVNDLKTVKANTNN